MLAAALATENASRFSSADRDFFAARMAAVSVAVMASGHTTAAVSSPDALRIAAVSHVDGFCERGMIGGR